MFPDAEGFALWAEHEPAWSAFCAVSSQWRVATGGFGGAAWLGLDFAAVRAGLDLAGLEVTPEVWTEIRWIEAGAQKELNHHG